MIVIGRLTKPHGLGGELIFLPYVYAMALLPDLTAQRVSLQHGTEPPHEEVIVAWRRANKRILVWLEGCHDRTRAEALRNHEVSIPRQCFPPLPDGEYYWFDIEGLAVRDSQGRLLGTIADIVYTGSNDVYVVRNGSHEILIPALKDIVRHIDLVRQEIHLFPGTELFV
ncbi:Ribosome maturation factor RimM [Candidatus Entotheonellaceae bacterium PAL068K]